MRPTTYRLLMKCSWRFKLYVFKNHISIDLSVYEKIQWCLCVVYAWWFYAATGTTSLSTTKYYLDWYLFFFFSYFVWTFRFLKYSGCPEKVVHIVNSPLILTSNGRFSQSVQIFWCCNSRGRLRLIFRVTTQQFSVRNNRYYELVKNE
jgi:hypothetical protein